MVMVGMETKADRFKKKERWQDKSCNIVLVTAIGTPVGETLALAGMNPQAHIMWLEMDIESPLVKATKAPQHVQNVDLWLE